MVVQKQVEHLSVPKGKILNIGRVEKQYTKTEALLEGDGDQILLQQGWPSEWIIETREVPSRKENINGYEKAVN